MNSKGESHCFHCVKADHWADACSDLSEEQKAQIMLNYELDEEEPAYDSDRVQLFNQGDTEDTEVDPVARKTLNKHHVYLDSCSTYHQFITDEYLTDIHNPSKTLKGQRNKGTSIINKKGKFGNLGVWLNKQGLANILSIPLLEKTGYRIAYDTLGDWEVHSPTGDVTMFQRDI